MELMFRRTLCLLPFQFPYVVNYGGGGGSEMMMVVVVVVGTMVMVVVMVVVAVMMRFNAQEDFVPPPPMDETASEKMERISATIKLSRNEISEIM